MHLKVLAVFSLGCFWVQDFSLVSPKLILFLFPSFKSWKGVPWIYKLFCEDLMVPTNLIWWPLFFCPKRCFIVGPTHPYWGYHTVNVYHTPPHSHCCSEAAVSQFIQLSQTSDNPSCPSLNLFPLTWAVSELWGSGTWGPEQHPAFKMQTRCSRRKPLEGSSLLLILGTINSVVQKSLQALPAEDPGRLWEEQGADTQPDTPDDRDTFCRNLNGKFKRWLQFGKSELEQTWEKGATLQSFSGWQRTIKNLFIPSHYLKRWDHFPWIEGKHAWLLD